MGHLKINTKLFALLSGPAAFAVLMSLAEGRSSVLLLALLLWMVLWWIFEPVPIPATALLPIFFFPIFNILDIKETTSSYANPIIFLFFGGFLIALSLEKHNLHKRIALNLIKLAGTNPRGIIFGFMGTTALLSMWISNTATAVMMLPAAVSIANIFTDDKYFQFNEKQKKESSLALFLGIAYAANIGGMATLIGTPPNLVLANLLQELYQIELDFRQWLWVGLPLSCTLFFTAFFYLSRKISSTKRPSAALEAVFQKELYSLGKLKRSEKYVISIFLLTVFGWILKAPINQLFALSLNDTMISIGGGLLMFFIPYKTGNKNFEFLLTWKDTKKLPWGIILLFGGGLSMAKGMQSTGLVKTIADAVTSYGSGNALLLLFLFTALALIMTEFVSNVALTTILLPIVLGIALALGVPVMYFGLPVTFAASCAFMMPIATPPNAVVFSSGNVQIIDMIKKGFFLNLISVFIIVLFCRLFSDFVL